METGPCVKEASFQWQSVWSQAASVRPECCLNPHQVTNLGDERCFSERKREKNLSRSARTPHIAPQPQSLDRFTFARKLGWQMFVLIWFNCRRGGEEICKKTPELVQRLLTYWVNTSWRINGWNCVLSCRPERPRLWFHALLCLCCSPLPAAGRFSLMRKANRKTQSYPKPWRRSRQNTTVSYRQIPPRAKHDECRLGGEGVGVSQN